VALRLSLIKTASPSFQSILNELRPDKFDDARVVVAICEVIQGRETMRLARPFHVSQLGHCRASDDRYCPSFAAITDYLAMSIDAYLPTLPK
jgi:hypothetical protein